MRTNVPVEWSLRGEVNTSVFTVSGAGAADLMAGSTELHLSADPEFPLGFDPALSQFMCNFLLSAYTAVSDVEVGVRDVVQAEMFVRPRRLVEITDAAGEQVVRLEALTTMTVATDRIVVTNYMTGFSNLTAPVVGVHGQETLLPAGPGTATGLARYTVDLADGQVLDGMTVVPYLFDRADRRVTPAVRSISEQACRWTSPTQVTLSATSRWSELDLHAELKA